MVFNCAELLEWLTRGLMRLRTKVRAEPGFYVLLFRNSH